MNIASGDGNLIQGNGNLVSGEGNLVLSPNDVNMNEIMKKFNSDALANQIQSRLGMMGNGMFGNQQSSFYTQPMIPTQVNTNYMQNSINSLKPGQSIGSQNYQQQQNYQPQQNYQQSQSYQPQPTYQNPVNNNLINQNLQNLLSSPKYNNNQNMGSFNNFNNGMNPQQQSSSLYSSIPQYFYQNPLYSSGQGTYWASFGGSPNYVVDPVIGQVGGYQQQQPYINFGSNVYQQPQYYGYQQQQQQQQVNYQGQYQPRYYQSLNQQYIPQVVYPQMNPYQQQQQQSYQPLQQQSYQQIQYAQQPTIVQQNNLRANNDLNNNNNNHQNSYMNL